jgi:predicted type IV restriction endonuclease
MTKEEGRIKLQTLIDNFEYEFVNQPATIRRDYNEATVRAKFLDPFFEALGWNMRGKEAHVE